jgi:hypothetical protein
MRAMPHRTSAGVQLALSLSITLVVACSPQPRDGGTDKGASKSAEKSDGARDENDGKAPEDEKAAQTMGRILPDAPIPLHEVLGHAPADAEKVLGEPTETGSSRISCVRFLPDRTFFACEQEARAYADKSGKFEGIRVEYEDGKAASIALTGLVGEGDFSPEQALTIVGLELPGEFRTIKPKPEVEVWDYWNSEARLVLDGKQYRVQVSVVDGEWPRSKVEIMINHPLTDDEKSRIKPAGE